MLQRCVHAFARGALPFRPVKSPLCSGLAGCCLCCARASAARSRLPRSGCTRSMRSSATLRARGIQSGCRSYRNFSLFQRSFWVTAIHIMRSHLDTWISRRWRTHVNLPNRVYNVRQQSRRERDACTPRRQPHWLAARGSYPAPTEGSCAPSRPLVCPSVRLSHVTRAARCAHRPEKSLRIIEKSMSAWRAGSWPAATNGCHGARTGAKEASAVSGSREGGGRGAHGRRALAAEEEMAESRQSTYRASEGALAMPAYRCFGIRLATVVEDLSPEGARQTSSL